jgi:hypothetical protein
MPSPSWAFNLNNRIHVASSIALVIMPVNDCVPMLAPVGAGVAKLKAAAAAVVLSGRRCVRRKSV